MTRKTDTRQQIIEITRDLLQQRGFNAFSYKDLAEAMGIRKASIHYHFPTKSDLAQALITDYRERLERWIDSPAIKDSTPAQKLEKTFDIYRLIASGGKKICPVGMLSANLDTLSEELRQDLCELMKRQAEWMQSLIEEGREKGAFRTEGSVKDIASLLVAAIQGAVQQARAYGSLDVLESVFDQIKRQLLMPELA